jgi:hypothetical protein
MILHSRLSLQSRKLVSKPFQLTKFIQFGNIFLMRRLSLGKWHMDTI